MRAHMPKKQASRPSLRDRPYLVAGAACYLAGVAWAALRWNRFFSPALNIAQLLASGALLALIGASLSYAAYLLSGKRRIEEWAIGTAAYYLLALAMGFALFPTLGAARILAFPILYAPLLITAFANLLLDALHPVPQAWLDASVLVLHGLFEIAFFAWLWLELRDSRRLVRRILLVLILLATLVGTFGCMRELARPAVSVMP